MVKELYEGPSTSVLTTLGKSDEFRHSERLHRGFTLSLYLFIQVLDVIMANIREDVSWCTLLDRRVES